MEKNHSNTKRVAGVAVLGALSIVFDYFMKFSGLKIPFPWYTTVKFDFTGVPIFLSLIMYGLPSGASTSAIVFLGIVARSGKPVEAAVKALSEFSTVLGASPFIGKSSRRWNVFSLVGSVVFRVAATSLLSIIVLPGYHQVPLLATLYLLPLLAIFNVAQGALNFFGGFALYELLKSRIPSLIPRKTNKF